MDREQKGEVEVIGGMENKKKGEFKERSMDFSTTRLQPLVS